MKRFGAKQMIPICGILFAVVFIVIGLTQLGFWSTKGPLPGFFPVIMAVILLGTCVLALLQSFREQQKAVPREAVWIVLAVGAALVTHVVIGLVPSLFLFVVLWLKLVEKTSWGTVLKVLAIIAVIVLGVFRLWLNIRFPMGVLGSFLSGLL